ncbi:hypothetical protein LCGC14_2513200 [marine sediment metagenome]|uniref:Uncharacterized protein n=1 Tax=marine sediment metagenome TaxID=412755 RepID=A0A0F9DA92_9ZZZZ
MASPMLDKAEILADLANLLTYCLNMGIGEGEEDGDSETWIQEVEELIYHYRYRR